MGQEKEKGVLEPEITEDVSVDLPYRVLLLNDDWHTFDDVINQIIKAIVCSYDVARSFAFEAHVKGKTIVFNGELNKCLKVSTILEEIALHTQIIS